MDNDEPFDGRNNNKNNKVTPKNVLIKNISWLDMTLFFTTKINCHN